MSRPIGNRNLKALIDAGYLRVGEELRCVPPSRIGGVRKAHLNDDGSVEENGDVMSLAQWSNTVKDGSTNAWISVTARGKFLDHYRQQLRNQIEPQQESQQTTALPEHDPEAVRSDISQTNAESLKAEIDSLKLQISDQQSAIARLDTKVEHLSVASPESATENDIIRILRERVLRLEPYEFEILVGEYLKAKGFSNVVVTPRSRDGGIDGHCEFPMINVKVAFQAKRNAIGNNIDAPTVQQLQGSMTGRFDRGMFITTSDYTIPARGWVEEAQAQITLINGDELMKEMIDLGLGVKAVTVVKHEVDEDFFVEL